VTIKINDISPKKYIILGCHQAGTSFVAKAIHDQNIPMSIVTPLTYENINITNTQEDLLKEAGGSWDNPPKRIRIKEIGQLIKRTIPRLMANEKRFAYKDPRTCLLLPEYMDEVCTDDTYLICIFRKPKRNAISLCRRGMSLEKATNIVARYNKEILSCIKQFLKSF